MIKTQPLIIKIYGWNGNKDFGYEVICKKEVTLRFNYMGKVHTKRVLTDFESELLKRKIKSLRLDILPQESIEMCHVLPDITTLVEIKSTFSKISISWSSSDFMNYKKCFASLAKFIETVEDMLVVDTSKLDLPMYC